jgi:hypothetical protein
LVQGAAGAPFGIADRLDTLVDNGPATLAQIKSSLTSLDRLLSELGTSPAQ